MNRGLFLQFTSSSLFYRLIFIGKAARKSKLPNERVIFSLDQQNFIMILFLLKKWADKKDMTKGQNLPLVALYHRFGSWRDHADMRRRNGDTGKLQLAMPILHAVRRADVR